MLSSKKFLHTLLFFAMFLLLKDQHSEKPHSAYVEQCLATFDPISDKAVLPAYLSTLKLESHLQFPDIFSELLEYVFEQSMAPTD